MEQSVSQKPKASPKDVFMHLLMIGMLYASAVSVIALLFQYVNQFIPDALDYSGGYGIRQAVRWSLSTLIVVFPVFLWIMHYLERDYASHPEKREIGIRWWLLNLTLFISAITIIVDLVTLVYSYLGGELTNRFLLKTIVVLAVASIIFTYYIWDLRRKAEAMPQKMRTLAWATVGIVAAIIIGGFFVAGSPTTERLRRFDDQRVGDLQSIQFQLIDYWQRKEELPEALEDLKVDLTGYAPPADPETGNAYAYRKTGDLSFELCAEFSLPFASDDPRYPKAVPMGPRGIYGEPVAETWQHDVGLACFSRTIDPEFYKPIPPQVVR